MVDPSGRRTDIGDSVFLLLWKGAFGPMKCPVEPVSAMAMDGGGAEPRVCFALILLIILLQSLGVPPSYGPACLGG
jgi:hypothetical protein